MTITDFPLYDSVTVRRIIFQRSRNTTQPAYRMTIAPVDQPNKVLRIPYAPKEVQHTRGSDYSDVPRIGKKPALIWNNTKRKEMNLTLLVADKYAPVSGAPNKTTQIVSSNHIASQLTSFADAGTRVRVTYGIFENAIWRISSITVRTILRRDYSNDMAMAEIDLTFTEVVDLKVGVGPVSGGVKPAPSKATPAPKTRTYIVKRGDTLSKISIKYYGTADKWRKIADANKLKNPNKISIGQKLKIP